MVRGKRVDSGQKTFAWKKARLRKWAMAPWPASRAATSLFLLVWIITQAPFIKLKTAVAAPLPCCRGQGHSSCLCLFCLLMRLAGTWSFLVEQLNPVLQPNSRDGLGMVWDWLLSGAWKWIAIFGQQLGCNCTPLFLEHKMMLMVEELTKSLRSWEPPQPEGFSASWNAASVSHRSWTTGRNVYESKICSRYLLWVAVRPAFNTEKLPPARFTGSSGFPRFLLKACLKRFSPNPYGRGSHLHSAGPAYV